MGRGVNNRSLLVLCAGVVGSLAIGVGAAQASSVVTFSSDTGFLTVTGDAGANDVAVGIDPADAGSYRIADSSGISDPIPPRCTRLTPTAIRCPIGVVAAIQVRLGADDDQFKVSSGSVPGDVGLFIYGEDGNDTIRGRNGPGRDQLYGGNGNDDLFGEGGDDYLSGGDGNDELDGGPGEDTVLGDDGNDVASGGGGNDIVKGGAGRDVINGLSEDDKLFGGRGNDKLFGGGGNDKGIGGAGNDSFNGGDGKDQGKAEKLTGVEK